MINKVILVGNVGQDPEIRYAGDATSGAKVATIRLATSERFKDRNGNLRSTLNGIPSWFGETLPMLWRNM